MEYDCPNTIRKFVLNVTLPHPATTSARLSPTDTVSFSVEEA
jgi:hypothetical protein